MTQKIALNADKLRRKKAAKNVLTCDFRSIVAAKLSNIEKEADFLFNRTEKCAPCTAKVSLSGIKLLYLS